MKRKGLLAALLILLLLFGGFLEYTGSFYRADEAAREALKSDGTVQVVRTEYGWLFDGPASDRACVFYPGGKVEETAYAPLLRRLAAEGMDVLLLRVPFHLAFFAANKAAWLMEKYPRDHWYLGGHSLGGAVAALSAAKDMDRLEGLILLAAYPTKALPEELTVISVYGSEDGVLNREKLAAGRQWMPPNSVEAVIEGGNHAQFGNYGEQKGDGAASISAEEQQEEALRVILETVFPERAGEEKPAA